jgi:hypothetical protein
MLLLPLLLDLLKYRAGSRKVLRCLGVKAQMQLSDGRARLVRKQPPAPTKQNNPRQAETQSPTASPAPPPKLEQRNLPCRSNSALYLMRVVSRYCRPLHSLQPNSNASKCRSPSSSQTRTLASVAVPAPASHASWSPSRSTTTLDACEKLQCYCIHIDKERAFSESFWRYIDKLANAQRDSSLALSPNAKYIVLRRGIAA